MVSRQRRDVPAECRFSHAIQGLVACQELFPELQIVAVVEIQFQPFETNTRLKRATFQRRPPSGLSALWLTGFKERLPR